MAEYKTVAGNLVQRAVDFAAAAHSGAVRKGTNIPYIVHPMAVLQIVSGLSDDEEIKAAAVLHDVKEDAGVSPERLTELFGSRVSELVCAESENKREGEPEENTWKIRKQETIDHLEHAARDVKMICLGDKLANMRDIAHDFESIGDELWNRFNAPEDGCCLAGKKANVGWYYRGVADRMKGDLGGTAAWRELDDLIVKVFNLKSGAL